MHDISPHTLTKHFTSFISTDFGGPFRYAVVDSDPVDISTIMIVFLNEFTLLGVAKASNCKDTYVA